MDMSAFHNTLLNETLSIDAMKSIRDPEGMLEGVVIVEFLKQITLKDKPKTAFIHPNYTANFYAPNENIMEEIKHNTATYAAVDFLQGPSDFDILLVPFHVRQRDAWRGCEHWMLAIYDKHSVSGRQFFVLYDPKPKMNNNKKAILEDEHRTILRHILKTVVSGQTLKGTITLPRTMYNCQALEDYTSCGIYVCYYAREYLRSRSIRWVENFDIQYERNEIYKVLEDVYIRQHNINDLTSTKNIRLAKKNAEINLYLNVKSLNKEYQEEVRRDQYRISKSRKRSEDNIEQHDQRKKEECKRKIINRTIETDEQKKRRREDNNFRMSVIRKIETDEKREERRQKDRKRHMRLCDYQQTNDFEKSYKLAIDPSVVECSRFGKFEIECIHCGALHFPEERTSGHHHQNSFSDCCNHGKIKQASVEFPEGVPMNDEFPEELMKIFLKIHQKTKTFHFHERIRNLNSSFALASFCVDSDRTISHGIYTFTVAGQVYHKLNLAVHPTQDTQGTTERPEYGQLYFLDTEESVEHRLNNPVNLTQRQQHHALNRDIVELLEKIIRKHNVFVHSFELMKEVEEEVKEQSIQSNTAAMEVKLLFTMDKKHQDRRYKVPTTNEISALIIMNADGSIPDNYVAVHPRLSAMKDRIDRNRFTTFEERNDITMHQRGKDIKILSNMDPRIEPFVYPLFYPSGILGWRDGLSYMSNSGVQRRVTRLMFARYRIAFRKCCMFKEQFSMSKFSSVNNSANEKVHELFPFNPLHFGEKLFQQYCIDTFIRVERDRMKWIKDNQKKIKAENYAGVNQFLDKFAEELEAKIESKIILPSTFPGSPRFYSECYEDAMALVRRYGTPDLFITMTCNPKWPEIQEALYHKFSTGQTIQQYANMRPDIISRVFKIKSDMLIKDIFKDKIFGNAASYVSVIEFQKRGLPHMHLLLILHRNDKIITPEQVDDFIYAEIPDRLEDPDLFRIVEQHMIHDPCGISNPNAHCMDMKTKKCRWNYPKEFQKTTLLRENEQPLYRRRNFDLGDNFCIYRKDKNGDRITMDNRNVAPYNAWLLKRYNCHINVEYVGGIKAVKYLYKYIYKGHDIAQVKVEGDKKTIIYDECERHIEGRYISAYEACWRLFEYELQRRSHSVQRLDVHLKDKYLCPQENLPEDLTDIGQKGSTLEAWFKLNKALKVKEQRQTELRHIQSEGKRQLTEEELKLLSDQVKYHYYWEVPEFYTWHGRTSEWKPKKRKTLKIGRMYSINPSQLDRYHLRLLLVHVKEATCYEDLLTFNNFQHDSYKNACLARGLTYDDKQWFDGLKEHRLLKMPTTMRTFFALILLYGEPSDPKRLWDDFKEDLAEDFIREATQNNTSIDNAIKKAYRIIAKTLDTEAPEGRHFDYWQRTYNMDPVECFENEQDIIEKIEPEEAEKIGYTLYSKLNNEQCYVAEAILHAVDKRETTERCFFIDGPGGTGKSFLFKALYFMLLSKDKKVHNMATTGIAATLLTGGLTAHKTFGLDVPLRQDSVSRIKVGSFKAEYLKNIDVFFLDESPMLPRYGMENIDEKLRELRNIPNVPFGGAVMIFAGDFRQCLPVQPLANQSELRSLSIKKSRIWKFFRIFKLTQNMRIDSLEESFKRWTLEIGDGKINVNEFNQIDIPTEIISKGDLVEDVFGMCLSFNDYEGIQRRAILCPFNSEAAKHNDEIMLRLPGKFSIYYSFDTIKDNIPDGLQISPEFLNSLDSPDLPPNQLKLKKKCYRHASA